MSRNKSYSTCKVCGEPIVQRQERIKVILERVTMIGSKTINNYHYECYKELIKNGKKNKNM